MYLHYQYKNNYSKLDILGDHGSDMTLTEKHTIDNNESLSF